MLSLKQLRSRLSRFFRVLPAPAVNPLCSIASAHIIEVPMLPLGTRMLATSKGATVKRGPKISSIFKLRTLRPERLEAVGQEVIDLSGKAWPRVPTLDGRLRKCIYEVEVDAKGRYIGRGFPEGTEGLFYYYRPSEGPELSEGVRFRVCESAAEFARGRDLLDKRGNVWGPKVLELVKQKEMREFMALCRAEQLIDEALIADIEKLNISRTVRQYQYRLSDPFYLDLARHRSYIMYVTRAKVVRLGFPEKAFQVANANSFLPLTGSIKVQCELSNLTQHKKLGPTLVVRVLDVVDPISVHPDYDGVAPVPVPDTLLHRIKHGRPQALAIPLLRQPMAEDLLALAKTTWG